MFTMPMFFFSFHAVPTQQSAQPTIGGAFVNCWIQDSTINSAEKTAREGIENNGWRITNTEEEAIQISRGDCGEEHLEYYDQALIDREVWVFHCYPIEDE